MIYYKILEMGKQKAIGPVGNIVLSQEVDEIGTLNSFAIDEDTKMKIVSIIEDMRGSDFLGIFLIAIYEDNIYSGCVGVLFGGVYGLDQDFYPPFLVEPDERYRMACDVAHHELSTEQKWSAITEYADKHNLMDSIIDLIYYYDGRMNAGIYSDVLRKLFKWELNVKVHR